MGAEEIRAYLRHLAIDRTVGASTQNAPSPDCCFSTATSSVSTCPNWVASSGPRRPARLPTVLARAEVQAMLGRLEGEHWLVASLLFGAGLRLMEGLRQLMKRGT